MILDKKENFHYYSGILPNADEIYAVMEMLTDFTPGRCEMKRGYYMIQTGMTQPAAEGVFETHRKYIDIQYIAAGEELLEWNLSEHVSEISRYDESKDITFYKGSGYHVKAEKGMFYILFPGDAHKACCHIEAETAYIKIVFKIPLE